MARCETCGQSAVTISPTLGFCADCIRQHPEEALPRISALHRTIRQDFGLPAEPPSAEDGHRCTQCANACRMLEGETGYCGLRVVRNGRLHHLAGTPSRGLLHWYYDPLPTNCVADWVCPGHARPGLKNLAVFYGACSFNCLFCQNWHFRSTSTSTDVLSAQRLAETADERSFCVCFFGGDPSPQMPHALATSHLLAQKGVRICWETNGSMNPRLLDRAVKLSLNSGGCIKVDLKAWDEHLHYALTGVTNRRTLQNFARVSRLIGHRQGSPLLVASTLLVPGYVDAEEVRGIAAFIASLNPDIPYALLGFHPSFRLADLPRTSIRHAEEAVQAALGAGLTNVRIANRHLLSHCY